jgi:ferric-dicitrate binding protein FerR (iron transport regulator)
MEILYTEPEEFLADPAFIDWVTNKQGPHTADWDAWLAAHPEKQALISEAVALLQQLSIQEQVPEAQVDAATQQLAASISRGKVVPFYRSRRWQAVTAAAVLLLVAGMVWFTRYQAKNAITTSYGQISSRLLPDGSDVVLNANSTLAYSKGWTEGCEREVWISGEAFFHVKKTANKSRFVVHAGKVDVIVTGTQFNVQNRDGGTNILLTEGSVLLQTADGQQVQMKPGDFATLDNSRLRLKETKEEKVLAWKEHKLIFDNTPMREVVTAINQHYGVNIKLADETIGSQTISCILPNDNLDVLLQSLEATMAYKIARKEDTIVIGRP